MELIVDEEFRDLIPELTTDEYDSLINSLKENGFNKAFPIVVWSGKGVIVDGHNRYSACQKLGIEPEIIEQEFESREAVINYMIDIQLARRNLPSYKRTELIGKKFNDLKGSRGGARGNSCTLNVAEKLAKDYNVSVRTVKSAGKYAETVERVSKLCNETENTIMKSLSQNEVINLSNKSDDEIISTWENVKLGNTKVISNNESSCPVFIKLDKITKSKLNKLSGSKSPQELIIELINAEWERRHT